MPFAGSPANPASLITVSSWTNYSFLPWLLYTAPGLDKSAMEQHVYDELRVVIVGLALQREGLSPLGPGPPTLCCCVALTCQILNSFGFQIKPVRVLTEGRAWLRLVLAALENELDCPCVHAYRAGPIAWICRIPKCLGPLALWGLALPGAPGSQGSGNPSCRSRCCLSLSPYSVKKKHYSSCAV